ncbi:MAG: hypothetical protein ACTH2A_06690 [Glutamicibacter ardleyensis]
MSENGLHRIPVMRTALEQIQELHKPESRWSATSVPEFSYEYASDAEEMADGGEIHEFKVCAHCSEIDDMRAYSTDMLYRDSLWPCATRKLADEGLGGEECG